MVLENKLNITDQVELNKAEEKINKIKAKKLFDSGKIEKIKVGTFAGLILGLTQFDVSADPILVRESLKNLIESVSYLYKLKGGN